MAQSDTPSALLHERLRNYRRAAGLTQEGAAGRSGLKRERIAEYETAKRTPGLVALRALAGAYGVPVDVLADGDSAAIDTENAAPPSAEDRVREAITWLDHVRRNLDGLLASGSLGSTPPGEADPTPEAVAAQLGRATEEELAAEVARRRRVRR